MNVMETFQTIDARENFLRGLAILSTVDNEVDDVEIKFFTDAARGMELPPDSIKSIAEILSMTPSESTKIPLLFNNKNQCLLFIREAIQLCYANGNYTENERDYVIKVAKMFNVPMSSVCELENWVIEGMSWSRKGDDLLKKLEVF